MIFIVVVFKVNFIREPKANSHLSRNFLIERTRLCGFVRYGHKATQSLRASVTSPNAPLPHINLYIIVYFSKRKGRGASGDVTLARRDCVALCP